jgi:hypothetical protein
MQYELDGFMEGVTIWRDVERLNSNTCFDPEIEAEVKGAAVFLALVSGRYLESAYCRKELQLFYQKAQAENAGISLENQNRVFNVLLYNIPHREWPDELAGISGLPFYDEQGYPIEQQEKDFNHQLRKLAREVEQLLKSFKKTLTASHLQTGVSVAASEKAADELAGKPAEKTEHKPPFTVFLTTVSSTLETQYERIQHDLARQGISVIADIPPPLAVDK